MRPQGTARQCFHTNKFIVTACLADKLFSNSAVVASWVAWSLCYAAHLGGCRPYRTCDALPRVFQMHPLRLHVNCALMLSVCLLLYIHAGMQPALQVLLGGVQVSKCIASDVLC